MAAINHLTNDLQTELDELGSSIRLQSEADSTVQFNYKEWAWAKSGSRDIEAATLIGLEPQFIDAQTAIFLLPVIECRFTNTHLPADLLDFDPILTLLNGENDLRLCKFCPFNEQFLMF